MKSSAAAPTRRMICCRELRIPEVIVC